MTHHQKRTQFLRCRPIGLTTIAAIVVLTSRILYSSAAEAVPPRTTVSDAVRQEVDAHGRFFAVPVEVDFEGRAPDGGATIIRIVPIFVIKTDSNWNLTNLSIISSADSPGGVPGRPGNPEPIPGPRVFGLTDLTHAVLFSPVNNGPWRWGFGPIMGFPTATSDQLGSGKWRAGPAVRVVYEREQLSFGGVVGNTWSFAGSSDRAEVNQLMARLFVNYEFADDWYVVSSPIITANWNAQKPNRWMIPMGGGIARNATMFGAQYQFSMQGFHNTVRPDGAPEYQFRVTVVLPLPKR